MFPRLYGKYAFRNFLGNITGARGLHSFPEAMCDLSIVPVVSTVIHNSREIYGNFIIVFLRSIRLQTDRYTKLKTLL